MTILDTGAIDFTYKEGDEVVLCVSDHLPWQESELEEHWVLLQNKLKGYMGFIQSGQYRDVYPGEDLNPCVKVYFSHPWPTVVERFLEKLRSIYQDFGYGLAWVLDPRDDEESAE